MELDEDRCRRICRSGDPRFDGWFFVGVTSTRIYCRPSCPARPPRPERMRFYPSAAAAQGAGFRACRRCRPDVTPGSPEWDLRADVAARAMRLIADGVVDREGVGGLARRLGYSERHLQRLMVAEVGAGPLALARAQRARAARTLIETTDLACSVVAFAAGFSSVRQFNDTVREVFAATPTELRRRRRRGPRPEAGRLALRLPLRRPFDGAGVLAFLADRAAAGLEEPVEGGIRRGLRLPGGPAVVDLRPRDDVVEADLRLADLADLGIAVARCRRWFDLDADPVAVDEVLAAGGLAGRVRRRPGVRVPGAVDGAELALRTVLGQQVSLATAARLTARITADFGEPLAEPVGAVTHLFPDAARLAAASPGDLPLPAARARALVGLAAELAGGGLDLGPGADRPRSRERLAGLPGIGEWTTSYVAMRALSDPDVWLGAPRPGSDRCRPWRSYALLHHWLDPGGHP